MDDGIRYVSPQVADYGDLLKLSALSALADDEDGNMKPPFTDGTSTSGSP